MYRFAPTLAAGRGTRRSNKFQEKQGISENVEFVPLLYSESTFPEWSDQLVRIAKHRIGASPSSFRDVFKDKNCSGTAAHYFDQCLEITITSLLSKLAEDPAQRC